MDGAGTGALPTRAPADAGSDAAGQHRLLCGRPNLAMRCDCGTVTYGAPLVGGCSLLDGPARVRQLISPGSQRAPTPVDSHLIDGRTSTDRDVLACH